MRSYYVVVKTDTGEQKYILTKFARLSFGRADRAYSPLEFIIPQSEKYPIGTFKKDMILEVWRDQNGTAVLDGETCYFIRRVKYYRNGTKDLIYIKAFDAMYVLSGREIEYAADSVEASKTGYAGNMMKEIVRENFISATVAARNLSSTLMAVQGDLDDGSSITNAFSRQYVYSTLQKLSDQSRAKGDWITFDMVYDGELPIEFQTFKDQRGQDKTATVTLSTGAKNLVDPNLDFDYSDEATAAYLAGKGQQDERLVGYAENTTALAESVWSRREIVSENFQLSLEASLNDAAGSLLQKNSAIALLTGKISETVGTVYGIHWKYGDKLRASYLGYNVDCRVLAYSVDYSNNDGQVTDDVSAFIRGVVS